MKHESGCESRIRITNLSMLPYIAAAERGLLKLLAKSVSNPLFAIFGIKAMPNWISNAAVKPLKQDFEKRNKLSLMLSAKPSRFVSIIEKVDERCFTIIVIICDKNIIFAKRL